MSKDFFAEMRKDVKEGNWLLPFDELSNKIGNNYNCFQGAYGITRCNFDFFNNYFDDLDHHIDVIEKLERFHRELGIPFRKVSSPTERESDEYVIVLYDYDDYEYDAFQGCQMRKHRFHFVRIEHDGNCAHKFGWYYPPCITTPEEIHDIILREDGKDVVPTAYYAIRKPQ